ncbi:MAG: hypothetical protein A2516_03935 [Alphaproteobacteria bacterium RIFOXYD12_FULL_60_8]|nr:MAG: hypothetical protein A2516_03935 [Alphaproteobacteria bacterium RIFOXYD12_FULL_60_8]
MKNTKLNYTIVGSFVLLMVLALVIVVSVLAGRTGSVDTYFTAYSNVSGVKYGTQVLYEGYPIGQVESISPDRSAGKLMFKIEMAIQEGWPIPEGSVAQMTSTGLLAAVSIDIKAGSGADIHKPGSSLPGGELLNMFSAFKDIAGEFGDLNQQGLMPLLDTINKYVPELMANLLTVSRDVSEKGPAITTNLMEFSGNFAVLSHDLKATKDRIDGVLANMEGVTGGNRENIDQSLADLRHTLQSVSRHIDSITYNLEGTTRNVHEFSRQIRQNPGVLLSGQKTADDAAKPKP